MMTHILQATAEAGANIALTKYWGNADPQQRIPANDSISITLDRTRTVTTVAFRPDLPEDAAEVLAAAVGLVLAHRHLRGMPGSTSWAALLDPPGWSPQREAALKAHFAARTGPVGE